jgi:D-alanyl-D-alanine carboxypeptidase-like protein
MIARILAIASLATLSAAPAAPTRAASLDALVRAYPDQLASHDETNIVWRDGTRQTVSDGRLDKSFDEKLRNASIRDQLSLPYPKGPLTSPPAPQDDPGRFRNSEFFDKMYGNCELGETRQHLTRVEWLPASGGGSVEVTAVNGIAETLTAVSAEIEHLPAGIKSVAYPSAGTFNCRTVKDTGKRSMHAYGAAIDLNIKFADYWLWSKTGYRNRIPSEIVAIFERHGFIWGGKWGHFDTMHFEYRPELLLD